MTGGATAVSGKLLFRTTLATLPLILLVSLSPAALAECAIGDSTPETGSTRGAAILGYYVLTEDRPSVDCSDIDAPHVGTEGPCAALPSTPLVFEESNGVPGLQRKDAHVDDTCGRIPGDSAIL